MACQLDAVVERRFVCNGRQRYFSTRFARTVIIIFLIKNVLKRVRLKQRRPGTEKWGTLWGTVNVEGKGTINDEDNYRSAARFSKNLRTILGKT